MGAEGERSQVMEVAEKAFQEFTAGLATGDWGAFLVRLSDDFSFWFPVGQYHGSNTGKEKAAEFFQYVSETFKPGLQVTVDRITANQTTVVFEVRSEGLMRGEPYKNRVAISFDFRGDQVCAYREYLGSDGKSY
jgi:ketosteroid isomerase-like protein